MFKGKAIISKLFALIIISVSIVIPFSEVKTQAQCTGMAEGQECTSGNYRITYTGIDEFGNRKFIVKEVNVGTDDRYIESPFLTDYLAAAYRYSVIVTTVLATVVIIFAGVLWITSGGNTSKIGRAKELIGRSVTGLVLAVGSYTILWTINPQLVEFGSLKILRVEKADQVISPGQGYAGVLALIGGTPTEQYGAQYMESQLPSNFKNNFVVLYRDYNVSASSLENDIKISIDKARQEGKGNNVYVIGYSDGAYAVFRLLENYQPQYLGLIDPSIPADWSDATIPKNTNMIWGSGEIMQAFDERREDLIAEINSKGGKNIEINALDHYSAVGVYFNDYFLVRTDSQNTGGASSSW